MIQSFISASLRYLPLLLLIIYNTAIAQEEYMPNFKGKKNIREFNVKKGKGGKTYKIKGEVVDEVVVMEGDIIIGAASDFAGIQAVAIDGSRWPGSAIPYSDFSAHPKSADIQRAIDMVNNSKTNLRLVPKTTQSNYIQFVSGDGCSSPIGMRTGAQSITIGSCSVGSIAHEILHSAGLFHEQSREDRDNFITIDWNNIETGKEHNFEKAVTNASDIGTYDYGSIMHYPKTAFSKNGSNTINIKMPPGTSTTTIGQRTALSSKDMTALNSLYTKAPGELAVGESKTVDVYASRTYNLSGVFLRSGQVFQFTTSSPAWNNGSTETTCDGYAPSLLDATRRHGDINMMTLTGEIFEQNNTNNYTGTYFKIGCGRSYTATKSGYLITFANDILIAYGDNSRLVTLTIKRTQ